MEYPSISEYKEAVQYADSFETAELQNLRPVMNGSEPVMTSGNFAVVFKMKDETTGELYALKCFTQDQNDRADAYRKIIEELRYVRSPYFIDLEYINEGIWAGDYENAFPVLLMPWVEGQSLDVHISKLVDKDPERLHLVAYEFSVMASWLVNQPFAHGDIKPDNIIVREDGSMVLVDYDGLFVPSMRGNASREAGTPSFRHPNRPSMPFDEKIDDFPLASINLSLYLIALNPSLLKKYGAKDRLLFSEIDYMNLSDCKLLDDMSALFSDAQVQRLYALFLIALSEGCLQKCENTLMLLRPPHKDFKIKQLRGTKDNAGLSQELSSNSQDLEFNVNGVKFTMKYVEGGSFMMGALDNDSDASDSEKPSHKVRLDSYYIGETQVTQALWQAVMGYTPSDFKGDNLPVECVTRYDCQEFIKKLNDLTGMKFSLPTEAQWEYAARGGIKSRGFLYSGSNNIDEVAWYCENSSRQTHQVATKKSNELGLYDMTGNVYEWCEDWFDENYYSNLPQDNPHGPSSGRIMRGGSVRVLRGGSCFNDARDCRVSCRCGRVSRFDYEDVGLRLVLNPTPQDLEFDVNGVKFTMKYVEGGAFMMGASNDDYEAYEDEQPTHKVRLDSYYMGETQVTQELWQAVMGYNPSHFKGDRLPVEEVSWDDCQEFVKKLNAITGKTFVLPTEAQWEYAARGGNMSKGYKYSGGNNIDEVAWYSGNSNNQTHIVANKKYNKLGLYDMTGNVWEWCNDWYDDDYYSTSPQENPKGPSSGDDRVLRGGSWGNGDGLCRVSSRAYYDPDDRDDNIGFRLALQV